MARTPLLSALERAADPRARLTRREALRAAAGGDVHADHVVLALPFAVLRSAVDYSQAGFSSLEVTRAQPGRAGILVDYTGGRIGDGFRSGTADAHADRFLDQIQPVVLGLRQAFNGRTALNYWAGDPFTRGSYAFYKVGQLTRFSGVEREPSGRCHFAGEHTSITFQGYLEGAVRSGERAANEVLARLR